MLNIGIVCYPTFGGSGVVATELGKTLANKGYKVHIIAYKQPERLDTMNPNIFFHEVNVLDYPLFNYLPYESALTSKIVEVAAYEKLDILHVHYAIPHASAAFMAKQILATKGINIPYITTLHGTDITLIGKDASLAPVITFAINQSDAVTAVSESLKNETYQHFSIEKDIKVIHNFIDVDSYQTTEQSHFRSNLAPHNEAILMHMSNFRAVKRIEDIVQVAFNVKQEMPVKLVLIGDGPERPKIENLIKTLGLYHDVRFLGNIKSTTNILQYADIFYLVSETESFGVSALEAMASGVPVISTNTGGLPEVNLHEYSGFLTAVGDVQAMTKYSLLLLKNKNLQRLMSQNAQQQAKKFDVKSIVGGYEQIYHELQQNKKNGT